MLLDGPGGGAFAFFFDPTPGHLTDLFVPTPGNLPFKKNANARGGVAQGRWALLELTDALIQYYGEKGSSFLSMNLYPDLQ